MDRIITLQYYQEIKHRVDKDLVLLKDKLNELQQHISPFKIYIQKEIPFLENLLEFYRKTDEDKRRRGRRGEREKKSVRAKVKKQKECARF